MKTIIVNESGIVFGKGNNLVEAFDDMKQWIDKTEISIDDISPDYRRCGCAENDQFVWLECSDEVSKKIDELGGEISFEIDDNGVAQI